MAQQIDVRYVNFYSYGSSALKVAPAAPTKILPIPRRQKARKLILRVDPIACVGILLAAVMSVLITVGIVQFNNAKNEEMAMIERVNVLKHENAGLRAEFDAKCDLEEVKTVALALGMVPIDDVTHVTIDMPTQ